MTEIERFWSKVDQSGGPQECWPWVAVQFSDDYGQFRYKGQNHRANRIALMLHLGRELLPGMCALHTCDNPPCCNPSHLYEGTQADNARDAVERGRSIVNQARGERHGSAKLTEEQVREIKGLLASYRMSQVDIAKMFGITKSTLRAIFTGKTWKHV